jgi:hypothetical protein
VRKETRSSGNNLAVGGDLIRRVYRCRLDAESSQPWRRTGFRHPELRKHVREHRGELLAALLTIARSWFVAGQPAPSTPILGSYERWCTVIGGILEQIQVAGFLADLDELYAETDEETPQWERLLERWLELLGSMWVTLNQLIQALGADGRISTLAEILPTDLAGWLGKDGFQSAVGKALKRRANVRQGDRGLRIQRQKDNHVKSYVYRVVHD